MEHNIFFKSLDFSSNQISRKNSNTAQDRSKREKWSIRSQTPYNLAKWGSIIVFWALIASFYSNVYIVWYNKLDSGDMGELGHNRDKDFLNSRSYKAMIAYKLLMKLELATILFFGGNSPGLVSGRSPSSSSLMVQRVPALPAFWDLEKTVLHEICVSGTVGGPLLTQKSPTWTYISQKPW